MKYLLTKIEFYPDKCEWWHWFWFDEFKICAKCFHLKLEWQKCLKSKVNHDETK